MRLIFRTSPDGAVVARVTAQYPGCGLAYLTGRPQARRLAAGSCKMAARERIMNSA